MDILAYSTLNIIERDWLGVVVEERVAVAAFPVFLFLFGYRNCLNLLFLIERLHENSKFLSRNNLCVRQSQQFRWYHTLYARRKCIIILIKWQLLFGQLLVILLCVVFSRPQIIYQWVRVVKFVCFFVHLLWKLFYFNYC